MFLSSADTTKTKQDKPKYYNKQTKSKHNNIKKPSSDYTGGAY